MNIPVDQLENIKQHIQLLAKEYGFQDARISDISTQGYYEKLESWLEEKLHGDMSFFERNQNLRKNPAELHPGTIRVISLRYDYLPEKASFSTPLKNANLANISRYALGRDYHKLMRKKLDRLCKALSEHFQIEEQLDYRVFVDSAPVMESCFAEKSGLGWKGKHTLIINQDAGSWFFLGEIFINLPLPIDAKVEAQCGSCNACINLCPTNAIVKPNKVDATRCISYLTIENKQAIPIELRPQIGNRIYGCDDCQLACPWNRYAQTTLDKDFQPRHNLNDISLLELWQWTQSEFENKLSGNPIRRIGYNSWLRNLAVAIGNGEYSQEAVMALESKKTEANEMVLEHINWAIAQLISRQKTTLNLNNKTQKLINCVTNMLPRDA
ncbi:tRNA epoxyqueuosine(34) reductase QueG [Aliikangiella sp. IMCC44359]|uniref:tRNA epoxyqueuosine(34) reductase QueG n=1 Tax=Aliikangiella sp. IMCC44359 TaxID=3459125 RepID=UPI00403ACE57